MPATTPIWGWTYPLPGDKIADGAATIGNFIKALEAQFVIGMNGHSASDSYTAYPQGMSVMLVSGDFGWPYTAGYLITWYSPNGGLATQFFVWRSSIAERRRISIRYGYTDATAGNIWTGFRPIASVGNSTRECSGQVTGTPPSGGGTIAINVNFPAERFDTPPRVIVCANATTLPQQIACSVANQTATGCTIYIYRTNATATSVAWYAVDGIE